MIYLSNISLSNNIGDVRSGSSGNQYFATPTKQEKNPEPSKLRIGEIVRGEISDRIDELTAYVKIPTGTFKAIVGQNLKKGDTLLFKVIEIHPQLVLKVHEVSTSSKNQKLPIDDLLRILDVPVIEFYISLLEIMTKKRKSILRDDIVDIYKVFMEFENDFTKGADIRILQQLIVDMQIYKVPLSSNLITKLFPLYSNENKISDALDEISKSFDAIPDDLKDNFKSYLDDIRLNRYNKNNIFLLKIGEGNSFYESLIKLSERDVQKSLKNAAEFLRDLISALSLWNIISFSGKTPFHYIIPYYIEGHYYIIRMVNKDYLNNEVSFYFSVPSENLGEVKNKVVAFQKQLQIYMKAESDRIRQILDKFKDNLDTALTNKNFKLDSLKIGLEDIQKELNELNKVQVGDHFTIVI